VDPHSRARRSSSRAQVLGRECWEEPEENVIMNLKDKSLSDSCSIDLNVIVEEASDRKGARSPKFVLGVATVHTQLETE
jgi:hypothetical protein